MSVPHSIRHEELLPGYALGALDGDDLLEMEAHLASCPECSRQLSLWQGDIEALADSVAPVVPSEMTRQRILRIGRTEPDRRQSVGAPRWLLAAAAAAVLLLAAWGAVTQTRLRAEVKRLEEQVASLDREVIVAREEAQRAAAALRTLAAPGVHSTVLAGLGPTPGAAGQTYLNVHEGKALFYAFDLPALGPDQTYQLWFIRGGKPVSAGIFAVDELGRGTLEVPGLRDVQDIDLWAVTIEPAGGVPQPTGDMVLKG